MSKQDKILAKRRLQEPNPTVDDILNAKKLRQAVDAGYVKITTHATLPLWLYMYTPSCKAKQVWNQVTLASRGLIRSSKNTIVARPFPAFFNSTFRSSAVPRFNLDTDWTAFEKMDGTLIVASVFEGQLILSTKGSFESSQIKEAYALWPKGVLPKEGETWLLEFISPTNKILVDYPYPDLVLLAILDNWTGKDLWGKFSELSAEFKTPAVVEADSVSSLLAMDPGDGSKEGFVLVSNETRDRPSQRVKVKFPSYVNLKQHLMKGEETN